MRSTLTTIARVLAAVAAALALVAAVSGFATLAWTSEATIMVETWRTVGFFTFAALFAYLAARPASTALWLIVLGNKLVLTVSALALGPAASGAMTSALWDGLLVLLLAAGLSAKLIAAQQSAGGSRRSTAGYSTAISSE